MPLEHKDGGMYECHWDRRVPCMNVIGIQRGMHECHQGRRLRRSGLP